MSLTEMDIKLLLREKYSGDEWAYFENWRNHTGFTGDYERYTDAVVIGLWQKNKSIIGYEIKRSRQDFIKDVQSFEDKHKAILSIATEFYYICEWGLIQSNEVPEIAGLKWIDSKNNIITKKMAIKKLLAETIPFAIFQSFVKQSRAKIDNSLIPVSFLGKDISQIDFNSLVTKRVKEVKDHVMEREINKRVCDLNETIITKTKEHGQFIDKLKGIVGGRCWDDDNTTYENAINVVKEAKEMLEIDKTLADMKRLIESLEAWREWQQADEKIRSLIKKSGLSYRKIALEMQKKTGAYICWETLRKLAEGITSIPLTSTSIIIANFFETDIEDLYIERENK